MKLVFTDQTYDKTGGGQNMVYEIVKVAYREKGITSILIGSQKSFVVKRLTEDKIPFIFYSQHNLNLSEISTSRDDLLINFHNYDGISKLREFKGRCIIWGILAPQITEWNRFGIEKKLTGKKTIGNFFTRELLINLYKKDSLISMDGSTSDVLNEFISKKLKWPIISIPVDVSEVRNHKLKKVSSTHCLQISYIGRSDDIWKIKPVKKFLQDLNKFKNKAFHVNIYTDNASPFREELQEPYGEHISIEYHTGLYGPLIRQHLNDRSDLHFSMGTAALEGGLAGLPTILIDPSFHDFPEAYRYRWLFQTEQNSLGRFISPDEADFFGITMEEVVETCFNQKERNTMAEQCIQYVLDNHSALSVTEKLLAHPTRASMLDICRFTPATWRSVTTAKSIFSGSGK